MKSGKCLGLAAAALLLLGVQAVGSAPAAAQDAEGASEQAGADRPAYTERRTTARGGNIYGSHGVIGHLAPRRGGYYAAGRHPHAYARRAYRPRVAHGYYGATRHSYRHYARRHYPGQPLAPRYAAGPGSYPFYARRYAPAQPAPQYYGPSVYAPQYGATGYAPQYYARRSYPAQPSGPAFATSDPFSSFLGTATNWRSACVNGRICVGGVYYRGGIPICRGWAACNY